MDLTIGQDDEGDPLLDATEELAASVVRCRNAAVGIALQMTQLQIDDIDIRRALEACSSFVISSCSSSSMKNSGLKESKNGIEDTEGQNYEGDIQMRMELMCKDARNSAVSMERCATALEAVVRYTNTLTQQVMRATAMNKLAYSKLCDIVRSETSKQHPRPLSSIPVNTTAPLSRAFSPTPAGDSISTPGTPSTLMPSNSMRINSGSKESTLSEGSSTPIQPDESATPRVNAVTSGADGANQGESSQSQTQETNVVIGVRDLLDDEDADLRDQLLSDVGKFILNTAELQAEGSVVSEDDDRTGSFGSQPSLSASASIRTSADDVELFASSSSRPGSARRISKAGELERTSASILGNASVLENILGLSDETLLNAGTTTILSPSEPQKVPSRHHSNSGSLQQSKSVPKRGSRPTSMSLTSSAMASTSTSANAGTSTSTNGLRSNNNKIMHDVAVQTDPLGTADLCSMIEHSVAPPTEQCLIM